MAHRLLLADDSVTIQRVIELTFADEDIEVMPVGDGEQAIERIRSERPDIVLADVDMPERNGFEVASFVKETPDLADIPVILLTGAFEPVDHDRVRACGCDEVLAKPFEPQVLIARVKELIAAAGNIPRRAPVEPPLAAPEPPVLEASFPSEAPPAVVAPAPAAVVAPIPVAPVQEAAAPAAPAVQPPAVSTPALALDDYFDQLDAAFAELSSRRPAPAPPASAAGPVAPPTPVLARTFSALLAEEENSTTSAGPPANLSPAEEKIVGEVLRRVVAGVTDKAIRQQVAEIVSRTAERLIREEIERLKRLQ